MAHENHIVDRLSTRLPSLLPDHIKEDAPVFEMFLQAYFEYLESEIIVLSSTTELEGIRLEDGTSEEASKMLIEAGTVSAEPDVNTSKLLYESDFEPYQVGEYIYGEKSGSIAKITVINGLTLIVDTISGVGFAEGETITGRDGNLTSVVKTYKENSVVANNRLLDYSDIDQTLETFLQYFQKDFIPSLDLKDTQNPRLTLKNIGSLYKQKGTEESVKFLMRLVYGMDAELKYPIDETIHASDSAYQEERKVSITMNTDGNLPKQNDKLVQYNDIDGSIIDAEAIVEQWSILDSSNNEYSLTISLTHRGEFVKNKAATLIDRDGVTLYTGTLNGIVSDIDTTNGSIYISQEDNSGDILDEDGNGLLLEQASKGSMYEPQDVVNFTGGKLDTDTAIAYSKISGVSRGGIEKIFIEDGGQDYVSGDMIVFDDETAGGNGAEAIIGSTGDELILEDALAFEQYEITAVAGQTVFGGISNGAAVRDDHGKPIAINLMHGKLEVHIDGIVKAQSTYSFAPDNITFTTNPNLSGGERVEIFTDKSRLLMEDGNEVLLDGYKTTNAGSVTSTDQRLRRIKITNPGAGYERIPSVFPGGYLYFDSITNGGLDPTPSDFQKGETVTGGTTGAKGTILRLDIPNNRLVIKRSSSHIGVFQDGETITGSNTSTAKTLVSGKVSDGTGAKIYAWSSQIGGVEKLTISDQGNKFDADAVIDTATTYHNMLIQTPTSTLNKDIVITGSKSGATAQVESYDTIRHILKYRNLNGMFIEDEQVNFESSDTFLILKNDPYTARGKVAGEGLVNDFFLSDKGYISSEVGNIHDSKYYQSHSYVIKVGETINNFRAIVKDLVHPSGHIFFGEFAVESLLLGTTHDGVKSPPFVVNPSNNMVPNTTFIPTIVIPSHPTDNLLMEDSPEFGEGIPIRLMTEDNHLLENEDSRDNISVTSKETIWMLHTMKTEVDAQDMVFQWKDAQGTNVSTDTIKGAAHVNILNRQEFITNALNTKLDSEIGASSRPAITEFNTFIQKSPRRDGLVTVLNLETANHDYYVNNTDVPLTSEYGNVAIRPADSGKVFQFWNDEEFLINEDGTRILNEEPLNYVRFDPFTRDLHGERILMEDESGSFLLEDETVEDSKEFFMTERSIELDNPYMYYDSGDRVIFEDGDIMVKEDSGKTVNTFIPIGPTLKTLNKIAFQNCYKISYYILDETSEANDEDKILMEDGISGLLSETSVDEGLSIKQMDDMLGTMYIDELDTKARRRTNIAFSSYVNSSNITNSALNAL